MQTGKPSEMGDLVQFMAPQFARADFKPEIFDNVIKQKGVKVIWEQGMLCSCIHKESGQPDYNCPTCKGAGYVYFDPKLTRAVVSSINGKKDQEHIGTHESGSLYLTPMSTDMIGFRDKFTFPDFNVKFSEVLDLSIGNKPRYPIIKILSLRSLDTCYKPGLDFQISKETGAIEWLDDKYLGVSKCSILYTINPVYIAMSPIHELRGTYTMNKGEGLEYFIQLPSQFQIKREDFLNEIS
jgi:hypothetical protein